MPPTGPSSIPEEEQRRLDAMLYPMWEVEQAAQDLPGPNEIALGRGHGQGHNVAHARVIIEHASLAALVARHHLYMAHSERLRLGVYSDPPNTDDANVLVYANFTSFSLHAVAAQMHLMAAIATHHDLLDVLGGPRAKEVSDLKTDKVYKHLNDAKSPYAAVLRPFVKNRNKDWTWLRKYRDRYAHFNPMLVDEMGIQYSVRHSLWQAERDKTGKVVGWRIGFGSAVSPETNLDEMLTRGPRCLNLLGKQLADYAAMLRADLIKNWSNSGFRWKHADGTGS